MSEPAGAERFVSAVVLAAGGSTRMGRPKLALPVRGEPMLRRAVGAALASRCREVIVVLGMHADVYRPLLDGLDARVVVNPDAAEGMGASIRAGVGAISPKASGAVVLLADQPFVSAEVIDRLITSAQASRARVAAAAYGRVVGVPAYFDRALFPELRALVGDRGARSVVEAHRTDAVTVTIPEEEAADIDTAQDLASLGP
ncbi:MAG: nucleotidyltransferase family protein [Armatimonadota bacterium]|nr:nucleotidyltransferase family protein [Armatimonadota bacterium]MDR7544684.1 nucleotidyltransferase family protein [Armatimonadota bacterium]